MTRTTDRIQIAVFDRLSQADHAVRLLLDAGVDRERLSVICPEGAALDADVEQHDPSHVSAESGALVGAAAGGALGTLAVAAGIAASGGTALLVAGAALPLGAAMGVTGGLIGAMTSRGVEPEVADQYDQALRDGRVLLAVAPTERLSGEVDIAALMRVAGARTYHVPA